MSFNGTPKASQTFKKSSLEGKKIWYFTAPVSVPMSSIKNMSLKDAKDGKPILEHNGDQYGFVQDSAQDKTHTKIIVPKGSEDGYRTSKFYAVDQTNYFELNFLSFEGN